MKKILIMTALAAGILTSCSEDELTSPMSAVNNNTIAFATNKAKVTTRSGVTIKSLDKFTVNAINADKTAFFGSELYTYDTNAGVFKSKTPHYWPTTGTLDFYAINEPGAIHTIANNIPQYDYANWAAETDLVAATALSGEKEIPYPLAFKHLTSQIYVSAEAENKTEKLTYKVTSIKMTAPSSGTYSFAETSGGTGTWEIDNSSVSEYSYNEAMPRSFTQNGSIELSSLYWNILPVTTGVLHFEVQYQVLQNGKVISDNTGEHAKDCIIQAPNLQAGKRYIYNFVLSRSTDDEITFTTSVSDWEAETITSQNPISYVKTITLSDETLTVGLNEVKTISVASVMPAEASKEVTWSSENPEIATVDAETGLVTGIAVGDVNIIATAKDGSNVSATCAVTVIRYFPEPDGYVDNYGYMDLGLPSGAKWAVQNVGATSENSLGLYFQWGSTNGYNGYGYHNFLASDYNYTSYASISTNLEGDNDAATVKMSSNWRMPSKSEMSELISNTNQEFCTIAGVFGCKFKSKTNESKFIFLPSSNDLQKNLKPSVGFDFRYWTSTVEGATNWSGYLCAYSLYRNDSGALKLDGASIRAFGEQIRGIVKE